VSKFSKIKFKVIHYGDYLMVMTDFRQACKC